MKTYNPQNWYWFVGGDQTKAFPSASGDYVLSADATLVAWLADGTRPTNIDTEANLGSVLAQYLQRPANALVLGGYTDFHAQGIVGQAFFKVLFNHENRIRALEAKAPLTAAQARAAIKALM